MRKEFWKLQLILGNYLRDGKEIKEDSRYDNRYTQT